MPRHVLKCPSIAVLALIVGACAAPPDGGAPDGSRLATTSSLGIQPPAECGPLTRSGARVNCGWTRDTGNAFALVMSETRLDLSTTGIGAASLASIPEPPRPVDGFEIDRSHVEAFLEEELPRATLRELSVSQPPRLPPGAIDCRGFFYSADDRGSAVRGRGLVCSGYDRPTTTLRIVRAQLTERVDPGRGQGPAGDFPAIADRTLGTLRMQ